MAGMRALLVELRALLSRPNLNATWNPLLVRIADRLGAGLPVYWVPDKPIPVEGWVRKADTGLLSDTHIVPTHTVVDLEDYLRNVVVMESVRDDGTRERVTGAEFLLQLASSDAGHYDETAALIIEDTRNGPAGQDMLGNFIVSLARVVAGLAEHLVEQHRGGAGTAGT